MVFQKRSVNTKMHAGFLILCWMFGVGALQFLQPVMLAAAVAGLTAVALAIARGRTLRLMRRIRILLLAIVVLFAGFTPGEAVFSDWPVISPSREGLLQALTHAGRLLAVVCCVAILLERLPTERLIGGLYALSRPLVVFGLSAERVAVRIVLVLRYVDRSNAPVWRDLLHDPAPNEDATERLQLQRERLGWIEWGLFVVGVGGLVWVWG